MEAYKLQYFRHFICGAGPLTWSSRRIREEVQIPIVHGYGLSETTCYSCFLPLDLPRGASRVDVQTRLPVDRRAAPGEPDGYSRRGGERAGRRRTGRDRDPRAQRDAGLPGSDDANEQAFTHGWFRSGDEGFCMRDEAGPARSFSSQGGSRRSLSGAGRTSRRSRSTRS